MNKYTVGNTIGKAPKQLANDGFFTAVHRGFTSEIVHAKHEVDEREGFIAAYIEMGFSEAEAEAIYSGE
jgi:hypothetical protein